MARDLRFQGARMTTSTNVTGSTAGGLPETRGLTSDWQAGTHFRMLPSRSGDCPEGQPQMPVAGSGT